MTVHNIEIAGYLDRLATLLEIEGANAFRMRAYRNAARLIEGHSKKMSAMLADGRDLSELPRQLAELTRIEGLGPKRVQLLYRRGWLSAGEVVNSRDLAGLRRLIQ